MDEPGNTTDERSNENRIALWPARNRKKGDNFPYLTGKFTLDGKEHFVTLWKRDPHSDREPVLSGQITDVPQLDI